jgi:hypothetical protein
MSELARFAKDGNADQCFAIIDSDYRDNSVLQSIALKYENGILDDSQFCEAIDEYIMW